MATVNEALRSQQTPIEAVLKQGLETIAIDQTIDFVRYVKLVLPLDGYVFWVRGDLASPSAVFNQMGFGGGALFNQPRVMSAPAQVISVRGSLHRATEKRQDETRSFGLTKVIFTSEEPVHADFLRINPRCLYIGTYRDLKFTFSNTKNIYQQAGIWHYYGDVIYPYMESQIIDKISGFNARQLIVSNSLPAWLALNDYDPFYGFGNHVQLYPSSLVEPNITPPFGAVHVIPGTTEGLQSTPQLSLNSSHYQQSRERVDVTLYGLNNDQIMNFVDCVNQYSRDYNYIGMLNVPMVQDNKVGQNELFTLAMSKTISYDVSYAQKSMRDIAAQYICRAVPSIGIFSAPVNTTVYDTPVFEGT